MENKINLSEELTINPNEGQKMDANAPLSVGSTIEGKVVARERSSLFLDLGINGTGIIYGKEFYIVKEAIKNLKIDDKIFAKIVELENDEGYVELSLKDATKEISWRKLKEFKEAGEIISVRITGVNKGGLLTSLMGIQAFLPVSQLSPENYPRVTDADKQKILKELQKFIGKSLEVKILDLLAKENKLILSEKAKSEQATKEILKNYKKGDMIEGKITGIADFGAFIKFPISSDENEKNGEIEGLIHISELDWQLVENPAEVVTVGEAIKAQIIDINNNQVFLSLKSLKQNPWEKIGKECKKDDIIKGKVTKFSTFGTFIEIMPKIRGLCHISEFESKEKMEELLKLGETYDFQIISIEPKEHRMSLRLKSKETKKETKKEVKAVVKEEKAEKEEKGKKDEKKVEKKEKDGKEGKAEKEEKGKKDEKKVEKKEKDGKEEGKEKEGK